MSDDDNQQQDDEQNILLEVKEGVKRKYALEPALFLLFFGFNLTGTILQNQLLKNVCLYYYGYSETICNNLNTDNKTKEVEEEIQPEVARIVMSISLIHSIVPAFLSLFLGPYSDKYGRKSVLNLTFVGFTLTLAAISAISYTSDYVVTLNPWSYALAYIPMMLSGGWPSMIAVVLCYITDITEEANRSVRLGVVEVIIFFGVFLGIASCSTIVQMTNPTTVFIISLGFAIIASLVMIFIVEETIQIPDATRAEKMKALFSLTMVKEMIVTLFRRRSFKERRILLSLIIILMFTVFTLNGQSNVSYLFVREKFGWTIGKATQFDSINLLITITGSVIGLSVLKKLLHFSDLSLAVISLLSATVDSVIKAFATQPWHMYMSSGLTLFKVLSSPMCRSIISSIIPNNEIGKIYSITSSFEALSGLGAAPLYAYIYSQTLTYFAGAFYLITAFVYCINLLLAFFVGRWKTRREMLMNPYTSINT